MAACSGSDWHRGTILHVDLDRDLSRRDEQRDHPEWARRPLAVGMGGANDRGVVAAASYEARFKCGIRYGDADPRRRSGSARIACLVPVAWRGVPGGQPRGHGDPAGVHRGWSEPISIDRGVSSTVTGGGGGGSRALFGDGEYDRADSSSRRGAGRARAATSRSAWQLDDVSWRRSPATLLKT
jgi:hypothetical protein